MTKMKKNFKPFQAPGLPPYTLPDDGNNGYLRHCPDPSCPAYHRNFAPYWRLNEHMKTDHGWPRKSIQVSLDRRKNGRMKKPRSKSSSELYLGVTGPEPVPDLDDLPSKSSEARLERLRRKRMGQLVEGSPSSSQMAVESPMSGEMDEPRSARSDSSLSEMESVSSTPSRQGPEPVPEQMLDPELTRQPEPVFQPAPAFQAAPAMPIAPRPADPPKQEGVSLPPNPFRQQKPLASAPAPSRRRKPPSPKPAKPTKPAKPAPPAEDSDDVVMADDMADPPTPARKAPPVKKFDPNINASDESMRQVASLYFDQLSAKRGTSNHPQALLQLKHRLDNDLIKINTIIPTVEAASIIELYKNIGEHMTLKYGSREEAPAPTNGDINTTDTSNGDMRPPPRPIKPVKRRSQQAVTTADTSPVEMDVDAPLDGFHTFHVAPSSAHAMSPGAASKQRIKLNMTPSPKAM